MKLGVCVPFKLWSVAKSAAGGAFDFYEENAQTVFQAEKVDWVPPTDLAPVFSLNCMVPGGLKVTGPAVDIGKLETYCKSLFTRASAAGVRTIVFGSGGARQVPGGFDYARATSQIVEFLAAVAPLAERAGITIVVEHLRPAECNILTTVAEAAAVVRRVNHPAVRLLMDCYHLWDTAEPLASLAAVVPLVHHVHLADAATRTAPGLTAPSAKSPSDYGAFFRLLKAGGYAGPFSIEATNFDVAKDGARVSEFLRGAWAAV